MHNIAFEVVMIGLQHLDAIAVQLCYIAIDSFAAFYRMNSPFYLE